MVYNGSLVAVDCLFKFLPSFTSNSQEEAKSVTSLLVLARFVFYQVLYKNIFVLDENESLCAGSQ